MKYQTCEACMFLSPTGLCYTLSNSRRTTVYVARTSRACSRYKKSITQPLPRRESRESIEMAVQKTSD